MLSILSKLKNRIRDIITKKQIHKRLRNYHVVMDDTVITVNVDGVVDGVIDGVVDVVVDVDGGASGGTEPDTTPSPPPPSPLITRRLFNKEIDQTIIKNDYEQFLAFLKSFQKK